jgi:hypothetical protein
MELIAEYLKQHHHVEPMFGWKWAYLRREDIQVRALAFMHKVESCVNLEPIYSIGYVEPVGFQRSGYTGFNLEIDFVFENNQEFDKYYMWIWNRVFTLTYRGIQYEECYISSEEASFDPEWNRLRIRAKIHGRKISIPS